MTSNRNYRAKSQFKSIGVHCRLKFHFLVLQKNYLQHILNVLLDYKHNINIFDCVAEKRHNS